MHGNPTSAPRNSIQSLGAFSLVINHREVTRWRAGKARSLLQYMLLKEGYVVPRETLYEALWPDKFSDTNSSSLKVAVHMLRGVIAAGQQGSSIRLVTSEGGYVLHADDVCIDFRSFERHVDEGMRAHARGDDAVAVDAYRAAMDVYRGDFLPNVWSDWASAHREWLRSRALLALERLIEANLRAGNDHEVISWCRQVLDIDPYHEAAYRSLMLIHAQLGHLEQTRRWYDLCRARLWAGLNREPDSCTRELHDVALRGDLVGRRGGSRRVWADRLSPAESGRVPAR
jgi:two-component SAPR family response regulator